MKKTVRISCTFLLLIILLPARSVLYGQGTKVDSLLSILEKMTDPDKKVSVLNELAKNLVIQSPGEAVTYGKEALRLAQRQGLKVQECAALRWMAAASFYSNQPDTALIFGRRFASLAHQLGDMDGLLFSQKLMAYCSESLNRADSASYYFQQYYRIAEEQGNTPAAASALNSLGVVAFDRGQYQEALTFYEQAKNLYTELRDTAMLALSYSNIGTVYRDMGQPGKAMEYLFEGLNLAEKSNNTHHIKLACYNIGLVHFDQMNYENALAYLRRSASLKTPHGDFNRPNDFTTIGVVFFEMGELDSAGHYYQLAREAAEEVNNQRLLSTVLYQQGVLALERKQWEAANEHLELALVISQQLEAPRESINAHYAFGRLNLETGKPQKAIRSLVPAIALADSIGYSDAKLEALENLTKAYALTGNYPAALKTSQKYIVLNDSLTNKEKTHQIADLETRYQTAQKEQKLAEAELEIEKKAHQNQQLLLGGILAILALFGGFQFWRNITRLKRKESELELSLKNAEAEKLKELDSLKSTFFANISHEFRTPLTLILAPLQKALMQFSTADKEGFIKTENDEIPIPARHVSMMQRNAERLRTLIDQLLDLSKLESGNMHLQVVEGDVIQFVRAMVFSFESLAERRRIVLETAFTADDSVAYFDKDKLEKILANLLSNAFKFTPEGGRISVKTVLKNGHLNISIADSGKGISKKDLDKIFERFYQTESSRDQGTGIGLSLVKELVVLHKGQIKVESVEGKGTVFKISLSVAREAFDENEIIHLSNAESKAIKNPSSVLGISISEIERPNHPTTQPSNHPLLLIVEDNPDLRQFIAETMQNDYHILMAENGKTGLETAIEKTPDLIISDVMMPEMDGFEMCATLKSDERTSHIPIILLTAKAGQQHKVEGLETGADDYLTKPFDEKELLVRAKNLVEQRRKLREWFGKLTTFQKLSTLKPSEVSVTSTDQRFLEKVTEAIEQNMDNEFFSVEDLASAVAFSRSQLHRKLKAMIGKGPNELIREFRLARAKELLEKGAGNVSEVAMEVGYSSVSYFTRSFKAAYGILPSEV